MNTYILNSELTKYIENNIFPLYDRNDEGHRMNHINTVIEKSLKLVKKYDADINMSYTIAAYHDLGLYIDRKTHEIISAKMFMEDENMKNFFNADERNIIKEAIEDHRASSSHKPRSIYGMIVSTADRTLISIDDTILRSYSYGKRNYKELTEDEQYERVYEHLINKYGEDGYARVYLEDKEFEESLKKLRHALSNKHNFLERIKNVVNK